jgi:hypothetical protein
MLWAAGGLFTMFTVRDERNHRALANRRRSFSRVAGNMVRSVGQK